MCLDLVDEVVKSEALMARLAIPAASRDDVADSLGDAGSPRSTAASTSPTTGPARPSSTSTTPTRRPASTRAATFQWIWLEDLIAAGALPAEADQFNSLYEKLRDRFATIFPTGGFVHFASDPDAVEDRQTVRYLEDIAAQAGIEPKFVPIDDIGLDADGRFVDQDNFIIQAAFKLYPWEDMLREDYAPKLADAGVRWLEPAWKAVLSNKGMLPLLWERHAGHPNLLPAYLRGRSAPRQRSAPAYVRKPLFSREGANIELVARRRRRSRCWTRAMARRATSARPAPAARFDGHYPVIGAWIVGDEPPASACARTTTW